MLQRTVVVIEDEPDAAELFAEMMQNIGFDVVISRSSTSALALVSSYKPAAVILDIMMPEITGLELLKSIRKLPDLAQTPVVLVSALSLPSDIKNGLAAGASAYLPKPVGFDELKRTIDKVVAAG